MLKLKLEKSGAKMLGIWVLFLAVIFILSSFGKIDWILWIAVGSGILLSLFVLAQVGTYSYFKRKGYKQVSMGDFVVLGATFFSAVVLINSLVLIPLIGNIVPGFLSDFTTGMRVVSGVVVAGLAIFLTFTPKPKA